MAVIYSNSYDGRQMSLTVTQTKGTSSQNYSTINWTLEVYGGSTPFYSTGPTEVWIDGVMRWNAPRKKWDTRVFPAAVGSVSGSFIKYHNNDGTCDPIGFSLSTAIYHPTVYTSTGTLPMESIPRYPTSNQSLSSKTETTINMNWNSDSVCDYVWYSKDNGYTWIEVGAVNASSGSYNISGLDSNTTYNIRTRLRRKDSQLTKDSDNLSITTYDWPKIKSTPDFIIGNSLKIGIYNPLNRSVQVYIEGDNDSEKGGETTTGDNITGYNDGSWKSFWYSSIPNKTGIDSNNKAQYKVRLICSAVSRDTTVNGGYYRIKNDGSEIPSFSDSNWNYAADLTQLTNNNNQVIIKNYSTITYTVNQPATSAFGATISKYVYKWGTKSKDSTLGNTVSNGENNVLEVSAVDSRGLIKTTSKTLTSNILYIPYLVPSLDYSNSHAHRRDGISNETYLSLRGNLSVMKFGTNGVSNNINSAKYKVYDPSNDTWSQEFNIPVNNFSLQESGYFTLNNFIIHENGTSGGFPTGKRYAVQVIIKDGNGILGTFISNNILITDGKIARDVYQDRNGDYHQGINGLANEDYNNIIYGKENITDSLYINGDKKLDSTTINKELYVGNTGKQLKNIKSNQELVDLIYPVGSIYLSIKDTNPGTLFGGTWEQIKDRFLIGAGNLYNGGAIGGEASVTLIQSELPNYDLMGLKWGNGWPITLDGGTSGSGYKLNYQYGVYNTDQTLGFHMNSGGGDQAHNNMPPYLAVYMWKRIA